MRSKKYIVVREAYDWVDISSNNKEALTQSEFDELVKYLCAKYGESKIIQIAYKKFRFINFVGFIQLSTVYIEILPKLSLTEDLDEDRRALINMIIRSGYFNLQLDYSSQSIMKNHSLLEILSLLYLKELNNQLNRGIHKEYIQERENLNKIKGKIIIKEQVKNICLCRNKAYCSFDEYSEDNSLNRVFIEAVRVIIKNVSFNNVIVDGSRAIAVLGDVSYSKDVLQDMKNVSFDRKNTRFKNAFKFAEHILKSYNFMNKIGLDDSFSALFQMNILYESYISTVIKQVWRGSGKKVKLQNTEKRLLRNVNTNRKNILLKPDIVLEEFLNDEKIIVDTKWKAVEYNGYLSYEQSDIYQMYAYVTAYEKAKRCILLYPYLNSERQYPKWQLMEHHDDKFIEIKVVRLDKVKNTIEDLKKILE